MTDYLDRQFDWSDSALCEAFDEVSVWSAMAGLLLLEHVPLRPNMTVLDVGCGQGFPLLELAQRLGPGSVVVGLDPWQTALDRAAKKAKTRGIANVEIQLGDAAHMPLEPSRFDLIVSNVGINNFANRSAALAECFRVARPGAVIALTTNLQGHMREFYEVYRATLVELNHMSALGELDAHVRHRTTVDETNALLREAGFVPTRSVTQTHVMRFASGSAFLRHSQILAGFVGGWREVVKNHDERAVFERLEANLNRIAEETGELRLSIPFAYLEASKPGQGRNLP